MTCGTTCTHDVQSVPAFGLAHSKRGKTVCTNAPVDLMEAGFLAELMKRLRPAVVRELLDEVFAAIKPQQATANVTALKHDLATLDTKIARLTAAVEQGAALAPLILQLQVRQAEREVLIASIASAETIQHLHADRRVVERKVLEQLQTWRDDLLVNTRQVLRDLLDGPLFFTAEDGVYKFEGTLKTGDLIAGLVGFPPFVARPAGLEPATSWFVVVACKIHQRAPKAMKIPIFNDLA